MSRFMETAAKAVIFPLFAVNTVAAVIGGGWLLIDHEWGLFFFGLAMILFGDKILGLIMAAQFILAVPAMWFEKRFKPIMFLFIGVMGLFNFAILLSWTVVFFYFSISRPHGNILPYLLWAYTMSTSPWAAIASEETKLDPKSKSLTWVSGVQIGALAVMASVYVGNGYQTPLGMALFFVPAAILGIVAMALLMRTPAFE